MRVRLTLAATIVTGCGHAVDFEQWVAAAETQLPALMCAKPLFSMCFEEGRTKCEAAARQSVRECAKRVGVPFDFPQGKVAEDWRYQFGECVGKETKQALTKKSAETQRMRLGCLPPIGPLREYAFPTRGLVLRPPTAGTRAVDTIRRSRESPTRDVPF